jgi:uncharacterized protein YukE
MQDNNYSFSDYLDKNYSIADAYGYSGNKSSDNGLLGGLFGGKTKSSSGGSGFGFNSGTLSTGLNTLKIVGDLWQGYNAIKIGNEQNKLNREAFEFNKKLSTDNFNLAKDSYDRRVKRSENISKQFANAYQNYRNDLKIANVNNNKQNISKPNKNNRDKGDIYG